MPKAVRITVRVLLGLFPLVAAGAYFFLVHPKQGRIERLSEELRAIPEASPETDRPTPADQRTAVKEALGIFASRALLAPEERTAPAEIERIAEDHGVQLNEVTVRFEQAQDRPIGRFIRVELSAEAPFGNVLPFFAELERSRRHVAIIQRIRIQVLDSGNLDLQANLLMLEWSGLLKTPREGKSAAEAGGSSARPSVVSSGDG